MLPGTAYVIRNLDAKDYGQWATATTILTLCAYLTNMGLRGTFVRELARSPEDARNVFARQLGLRVALACLAGPVAIIICLALRFPNVVLYCTIFGALGMILNSAATTANDFLQSQQKFSQCAAISIVSGIFVTGASVVVVWAGKGILWVAASYLTGAFAAMALQCAIVYHRYFLIRLDWNFGNALKMIWHAKYFAIQQLASSLSQSLSNLIFASYLGPVSFGYLTAGTLIPDRLIAIPDGLATAAYPAIANAQKRGHKKVFNLILAYMLASLSLCTAAAVLVSFLAGPIATYLFPRQPEICTMIARITIWYLPVAAVQLLVSYSLNALHRDAALARVSTIGVVIYLVLAPIMLWKLGLVGACWAIVLRPVIQLALISILAVRLAHSKFKNAPHGEQI